jgi:hypothetical protein
VAGAASLRRAAARQRGVEQEQQNLAMAATALKAFAFARHCANPAQPLAALLPCPDGAAQEGVAATTCGTVPGWLPWKTLGLPPLKDRSGTCLWYEPQGLTARVIAPGAALAGQNRAAASGRQICGGNRTVSNYVDSADVSHPLALDVTTMLARCP